MQLYHGIDIWAMYQGRYEEAEAVHHIKPLKDFPDLAYNDDNLIPLSAYSHDRVEKAYSKSEEDRTSMQIELKKSIYWYREKYLKNKIDPEKKSESETFYPEGTGCNRVEGMEGE